MADPIVVFIFYDSWSNREITIVANIIHLKFKTDIDKISARLCKGYEEAVLSLFWNTRFSAIYSGNIDLISSAVIVCRQERDRYTS